MHLGSGLNIRMSGITAMNSDVFIKTDYRHHGYGLQMIKEAILGRWEKEAPAPVFLEIMHYKLENFYAKAGFELLSDTVCMVLLPENLKS